MAQSTALRLQLSQRLRMNFPPEWGRFSQLWMAFNAIYGGEPDERECARVKAAIRKHIPEGVARQVLNQTDIAISRIIRIPPGDMRVGQWDPDFRRRSRKQVRSYKAPRQKATVRLCAVGAILYQVRCNLVHGSKDPLDARDLMLVRENVRLLEVLIPTLQDAVAQQADP